MRLPEFDQLWTHDLRDEILRYLSLKRMRAKVSRMRLRIAISRVERGIARLERSQVRKEWGER